MNATEIIDKGATATAAIAGLIAAAVPVTAPAMGAVAGLALAAGAIAKAFASGDEAGAVEAIAKARKFVEDLEREKMAHFAKTDAETRAELERLAAEKARGG